MMRREVFIEEVIFELGFVGRVEVYQVDKIGKGILDSENNICSRDAKSVVSLGNGMWFGGVGVEDVYGF